MFYDKSMFMVNNSLMNLTYIKQLQYLHLKIKGGLGDN